MQRIVWPIVKNNFYILLDWLCQFDCAGFVALVLLCWFGCADSVVLVW